MLTIDKIACQRGQKIIFSDVGLTLGEGGFLKVLGANGAGKTSLLRIIAGLMRPKSGAIYYEGEEITKNLEEYLSNIFFLSHKNVLNQALTVKENLEFWADLFDTKTLLGATCHYFNLAEMLDLPVYMLSQGWKKRIALSRMMLSDANLWILDEPFANLDDEASDMLLRLIAAKCDQGGIVVASSHKEVNLPFGQELNISDFGGAKCS